MRCQGIAAAFDRGTESLAAIFGLEPAGEYLNYFVPGAGLDLFIDPPVGEHFDPVLEERG